MSSIYEKDCDDMRMYALEQQIEQIIRDMKKDRLEITVQRIRALAQQKTIDLMSIRLDRILDTVELGEK